MVQLRKLNPNFKRPTKFKKVHTIYFTVRKIQKEIGGLSYGVIYINQNKNLLLTFVVSKF